MKPPHWLCLGCGIVIVDQGPKPRWCLRCENYSHFYYLGYEGEYTIEEAKEIFEREKELLDLEEWLGQSRSGENLKSPNKE